MRIFDVNKTFTRVNKDVPLRIQMKFVDEMRLNFDGK